MIFLVQYLSLFINGQFNKCFTRASSEKVVPALFIFSEEIRFSNTNSLFFYYTSVYIYLKGEKSY
jgi:hypothetical protein